MESIDQFLAMQTRAWELLDWPALGHSYCEGDGSTFFDAERLDLIRQVGNEVSLALIERLNAGGRSVYVGAGVAELIPILCEAFVLERDVRAVSLNQVEVELLNAVLAELEAEFDTSLPRIQLAAMQSAELTGAFDHAWVASVMNDPDAFPALHDTLYERFTEADGATGRGSLTEDTRAAEELMGAVTALLTKRACLSTSDEEWSLFGPYLEANGWFSQVDDDGVISAIVGDNVRQIYVRKRRGKRA